MNAAVMVTASLAQKRKPDGDLARSSRFNLLPHPPLRAGVTVAPCTAETLQESFRLAAPRGGSCASGRSGLGRLRPRGPRKHSATGGLGRAGRLRAALGANDARSARCCAARRIRAPARGPAAPAAGGGREAREAGAAPGPGSAVRAGGLGASRPVCFH